MLKNLILLMVLTSGLVIAQEATAPTLTDVQKLTLQNKYLLYENARLKLETVQGDLLAYVRTLEKEGYTIDIGSASYIPVAKK